MRVMGIDGYRGGWVACVVDAHNFADASIVLAEDLTKMIAENKIDLALIDMPIGLSSGPAVRDVEVAMRTLLKGKSSSVFNTPARQALCANSREEASRLNEQFVKNSKGEAMKIGAQSFALFEKIREVDGVVGEIGQDTLREGHPEVSFTLANDEMPIMASKKSARGYIERADILSKIGFEWSALFRSIPTNMNRVLVDDVLDAMILSWSAVRATKQQHRAFPQNPRRDALGYEMVVWA